MTTQGNMHDDEQLHDLQSIPIHHARIWRVQPSTTSTMLHVSPSSNAMSAALPSSLSSWSNPIYGMHQASRLWDVSAVSISELDDNHPMSDSDSSYYYNNNNNNSNNNSNNDSTNHPLQVAVQQTWDWCTRFVARYHLCPWAAKSVQTPRAVHLYYCSLSPTTAETTAAATPTTDSVSVDDDTVAAMTTASSCVAHVAYHWWQQERQRHPTLQHNKNHAIAFLVFDTTTTTTEWPFAEFYDWFCRLEEDWYTDWWVISDNDDNIDNIDNDDENDRMHRHSNSNNHNRMQDVGPADDVLSQMVRSDLTLAAFHPAWQFDTSSLNDDDDDNELEDEVLDSRQDNVHVRDMLHVDDEDDDDDDDDDNDNQEHQQDDEDAMLLAMEKQSPWPTISLVWTSVIEQAGPLATEQIAAQNAKTLLSAGTTAAPVIAGQSSSTFIPPPSSLFLSHNTTIATGASPASSQAASASATSQSAAKAAAASPIAFPRLALWRQRYQQAVFQRHNNKHSKDHAGFL